MTPGPSDSSVPHSGGPWSDGWWNNCLKFPTSTRPPSLLNCRLRISRSSFSRTMSFANVVPGKLKLKGKALDVKNGGVKKKKRRTDEGFLLLQQEQEQQLKLLERSDQEVAGEEPEKGKEGGSGEQQLAILEDHRTPAEKVYDEQRAKLEARRLAKMGSKSHRQKVEEFNQYLANLSEHYDIPKVGPG